MALVRSASPEIFAGVPPGVDPVAHIRAASPLPVHAEELIDAAVTRQALARLSVWDDIVNVLKLTYPIADWLGTMEIKWQKLGRAGGAKRTMLPDPGQIRGEDQKPGMGLDGVPVFCTWDDFTIHQRLLHAWARQGQQLDTTMVEQATRNVNESFEDLILYGASDILDSPFPVYGLLNAPSAVPTTFPKWTGSSVTGGDILKNIIAFVKLAQGQHHYGPFRVYISTFYGNILAEDYKEFGTISILARLLENKNIGAIVQADLLPEDSVVLLDPVSTVIDVAIGQSPIALNWQTGPTALSVENFLVLGVAVPRIKVDSVGQGGIVVATGI